MTSSDPALENKYFISAKPRFFTSENRILVFGLLATTITLVGAFVIIYHQLISTLDDRYDEDSQALSQALTAAVAAQMDGERAPVDMRRFLDQLIHNQSDLAYIEIQDNNGTVHFRSQRPAVAGTDNLTQQTSKLYPLNNPALPAVGSLHVGLLGLSRQNLAAAVRFNMTLAFLCAWALSCLAVVGISWILSKHLRTLVRGVKRLSTGDFGYRIPSQTLWGELKHLAESFNDMSARLRVYEDQNIDTLTFERNKLEAILLSITDGVLVADNDGEVVIINESACDMLNVKNSDLLLGTKITHYTTDEGETCFSPIIRDFHRFIADGDPETFIRSAEFDNRTLRLIISPIEDTEGASLGFVMILRDITREMEIDKMKTQFISNVSHELRTPVTTIKSYVDTIVNHGNELDPETYQEFMDTINFETDRLKRMVNDILDFSRLEAPEYKMEMDYQDVAPLINLTVQSVKLLAEQKKLTITTTIESGLPKVYMNSDSIERALRNLLGNAIKYTADNGRIKVRAEVVANGQEMEISVEDNGVGIPEEHLSRIWDRFYRVENAVHTVKGTGLGLHLVKVAVEEHHHGSVFVRSRLDNGSVFGFRLPLVAGGPINGLNPQQTLLEA